MKGEELLSNKDFAKCVEFHGHICPGLSIGFKAAKVLMARLGARKAPDEELVAVVETDACGVDAIQVMTGCTFGKGNLIFKNYGKHAFSLVNRKKGKAMRVCLRPDAFKADSEYLSIFEKVQNNKASSKELTRFKELQQERVLKILDADAESLFKFEKILPDIFPKAQVTESGICDFCKEPTKVDLLRSIGNKKVCILCVDQHGLNDHEKQEEKTPV